MRDVAQTERGDTQRKFWVPGQWNWGITSTELIARVPAWFPTVSPRPLLVCWGWEVRKDEKEAKERGNIS